MFLSIIIPVYNTEKYLSECLESIINQDFTDYEVILVDDGSTDNSGKICDEYADKYSNIKAFHKENEGQLMARMYGLSRAIGDYCWFVDSDDLISESAIQKLYTKIVKFYPDMVIIGNYNLVGKKIKTKLVYDREFFENINQNIYKTIVYNSDIDQLWKKILKREKILFLCQMEEKYKCLMAEDSYQSLYIFDSVESVLHIKDYLYVYRTHNNSVSHKKFSVIDIPKLYNSQFYVELQVFAKKWGVCLESDYNRIKIRSLINWIDVFNRIYRNLKSHKEKKECMDYDWEGLLLNNELSQIKNLDFAHKLEYKIMKSKNIYVASFYFSIKKVLHRIFRNG